MHSFFFFKEMNQINYISEIVRKSVQQNIVLPVRALKTVLKLTTEEILTKITSDLVSFETARCSGASVVVNGGFCAYRVLKFL